jgi:dTDP-4-amino-4,6-dideoxygalactose transaminase
MPVELDAIAAFAKDKGLPIIEDAAQSIGATYHGRQAGSIGLVNATSFYPGKNLGAYGEGGAVMTNDAEIAARVRRLRDHAQSGRHHHVELGFNWRLDGFQGAVLSLKLEHLDAWNARRRDIAGRYQEAFAALPGVRLLRTVRGAEPIWHVFPLFHDARDAFRARLEQRGVQTGVHYPTPVHLQPAYAHLGLGAGALPHAERAARTELSLPMFPELEDAEVDQVIAAVVAVARELG